MSLKDAVLLCLHFQRIFSLSAVEVPRGGPQLTTLICARAGEEATDFLLLLLFFFQSKITESQELSLLRGCMHSSGSYLRHGEESAIWIWFTALLV